MLTRTQPGLRDLVRRVDASIPAHRPRGLRLARRTHAFRTRAPRPSRGHPRHSRAGFASRARVDAAGHAMVGAAIVLKAEGYTLVSRREEGEAGFSNYVSCPDEKWRGECDASGQCTIPTCLRACRSTWRSFRATKPCAEVRILQLEPGPVARAHVDHRIGMPRRRRDDRSGSQARREAGSPALTTARMAR